MMAKAKHRKVNVKWVTVCALGAMVGSLAAEAGGGGYTGPGGYGGGPAAGGAVPDAARRAVARRQERIAQADEAALRGQRLLADGDYEGAVAEFRTALDLLPDAPVVADRRREYTRQFADASVLLARERAEEGRYSEAIDLVTEVLDPSVDPENEDARRLLEDLNDPEIYSPALTPEHIARVKQVELALKTAASYIRLGDYNNAETKYHEVLNYDPYNSAARRGLENVERYRREYYQTAYDHTRAKFLTDVSAEWEIKPPRFGIGAAPGETMGPVDTEGGVAYIQEKLKNIVIPEIEFEDTPLSDAVDFLRQKSIELDDMEPDPAKKGVNIVIRADIGGGGGAAPAPAGGDDFGFGGDAGGGADMGGGGGLGGGEPRITLKLSNVPLVEALRYTTDLARLKYKVEPNAVVIIPQTEVVGDVFTQVFRVPPNFLSIGADGGGGGGGAADDPFADLGGGGGDAGGGGLRPRMSAREILEKQGVTFGEGASAIFNATTSQLIVRNTQSQLDLIDAYVQSLIVDVQKQIYITTKFLEINQDDNEQLGFDWLLGITPFGSGNSYRFTGGTVGSTGASVPDGTDFPLFGTIPATNPVTAGLRTGTQGIRQDSIDRFLNDPAPFDAAAQESRAPGIFAFGGVLGSLEYQVVLRALNQHKGTDLMTAPSVVARSGQRAKIEVIREFIYPSEYDPPEIPDNIGGGGGNNNNNGGGFTGFPVTPANPAAWETRNVGVTLEVDPVIGADGFTIDLNLNPEVVEFDGFINYGTPIRAISPPVQAIPAIFDSVGNLLQAPVPGQDAQTLLLTENRINMPIFSTRRVTTAVTIWDGQTVAIGGLIQEDIQHVQDKVPVLGDLPLAGVLFRSEGELKSKKNLTVFVTTQLIDPSGQPINQQDDTLPVPPEPEPTVTRSRPPTVLPPSSRASFPGSTLQK